MKTINTVTTPVMVSSETGAIAMVKRARNSAETLYGINDDFMFQYEIKAISPTFVIKVTASLGQIGEAVAMLYR